MNQSKLRRQITWQAAKLLFESRESDYYRARIRAARSICKGWVKPKDLPSDAEIRHQMNLMIQMQNSASGNLDNTEIVSDSIRAEEQTNPFTVFRSLLAPLENVKQNPRYHPEGDALYHSLQVFDLACDRFPYDEEFLLAALLHDVGKGIDSYEHVDAGLHALDGLITERTEWLIRHHMDAHKLFDRTIGLRARRRLEANPNFDDLVALGECDRAGRKQGVETTALDDALDYIRGLESRFDV
jgi:hypothetical protein